MYYRYGKECAEGVQKKETIICVAVQGAEMLLD